MKYFVSLLLFVLAALSFAPTAFGKIGVGVGTGKIQVDEQLKPGTIYQLPVVTVLNTGDTPSDYKVSVAYHQDQKEKRPEASWFIFSPSEFRLDPTGVKAVEIKLNLPVRTEPGDYFAYLEASPLEKAEKGKTSIGVAAAAKLYFTVVPANPLEGLYYKITSFWRVYSPWTERASIAILALIFLLVFKRFFNVQVNLKPAKKEETRE